VRCLEYNEDCRCIGAGALDEPLMTSTVKDIVAKKKVTVPNYDFVSHSRSVLLHCVRCVVCVHCTCEMNCAACTSVGDVADKALMRYRRPT